MNQILVKAPTKLCIWHDYLYPKPHLSNVFNASAIYMQALANTLKQFLSFKKLYQVEQIVPCLDINKLSTQEGSFILLNHQESQAIQLVTVKNRLVGNHSS